MNKNDREFCWELLNQTQEKKISWQKTEVKDQYVTKVKELNLTLDRYFTMGIEDRPPEPFYRLYVRDVKNGGKEMNPSRGIFKPNPLEKLFEFLKCNEKYTPSGILRKILGLFVIMFGIGIIVGGFGALPFSTNTIMNFPAAESVLATLCVSFIGALSMLFIPLGGVLIGFLVIKVGLEIIRN